MPTDTPLMASLTELVRADPAIGFRRLALLSGLAPGRDFRSANFAGVDLSYQRLSDFDLSEAQFVGTKVEGAIFNDTVQSDRLHQAIGRPAAIGRMTVSAPTKLSHRRPQLGKLLKFLATVRSAAKSGLPVEVNLSANGAISTPASFLSIATVFELRRTEASSTSFRRPRDQPLWDWLDNGSHWSNPDLLILQGDEDMAALSDNLDDVGHWCVDHLGDGADRPVVAMLHELIDNIVRHGTTRARPLLWLFAAIAERDQIHLMLWDNGRGIPRSMSGQDDAVDSHQALTLLRSAMKGGDLGRNAPDFARGLPSVLHQMIDLPQALELQIVSETAVGNWTRSRTGKETQTYWSVAPALDGTAVILRFARASPVVSPPGEPTPPTKPKRGWWRL